MARKKIIRNKNQIKKNHSKQKSDSFFKLKIGGFSSKFIKIFLVEKYSQIFF
jgi:hypothetical protein